MLSLFAHTRIGTRLALALGVVVTLFVAATLYGLDALAAQDQAVRRVHRLQEVTRDVQEIKYFNSDVSGWQVSYAWEAALGDPRAAVKPDGVSRAGYLEVVGRLRKHLAAVHTGAMTESERSVMAAIRKDWDAFLAMDDSIVELFAAGDRASFDKANETISGPS